MFTILINQLEMKKKKIFKKKNGINYNKLDCQNGKLFLDKNNTEATCKY
jgi:hypothetical protein